MKRAVLLVGHGSKITGSSDAMDQVLESLRKKEPATFFQPAFLELQSPSIPQAIDLCVSRRCDEIIVIPYFVQTGRHVVHDIPNIVVEAQTKHTQSKIRLGSYVGFDERIVSVVHDNIKLAREDE